MGSKIGDQVGSGGANRRPGGAQWMYGTERDTPPPWSSPFLSPFLHAQLAQLTGRCALTAYIQDIIV